MRRREFITLLGGAAAFSSPPAVVAQKLERMKRIGVLSETSGDPLSDRLTSVFVERLKQLGWKMAAMWASIFAGLLAMPRSSHPWPRN